MELDSSLSWMALTLTPGIAARLSARLLKEFGSPDEVFRQPLRRLEACNLPAPSAQAIINWTEPEYPQTLLQIYDPPVMLYVRGNSQILIAPSLSIVGTRKPTLVRKWRSGWAAIWPCAESLSSADSRVALTPSRIKGRWLWVGEPSVCSAQESTFAIRRKIRSYTRRFWKTARSSANFRWVRTLLRKIFRFAIAS
jgi:hypothetical protein